MQQEDFTMPTSAEVRASRDGGLLPAALVDELGDFVEETERRSAFRRAFLGEWAASEPPRRRWFDRPIVEDPEKDGPR